MSLLSSLFHRWDRKQTGHVSATEQDPSSPFGYRGSDRAMLSDGFNYWVGDDSTAALFEKLSKERQLRSLTLLQHSFSGELAGLLDYYGSDKGSRDFSAAWPKPYPWQPHTYGHFYEFMFRPIRDTTRLVFECGLGTSSGAFPANMGDFGKPGASLRAWRDFFPNAHIYGADIDRSSLFSEERITTNYVDQTQKESVTQMWQAFALPDKVDIIIDDGLHNYEAGSTLFTSSFDRLRPGGIYIIEDIAPNFLPEYDELFSSLKLAFQINAAPRLTTNPLNCKPGEIRMDDNIFILIIK